MLDRLLSTIRKLMPMRSIEDVPVLDEDELHAALSSDAGVVVCFYAGWCGFCRAFLPTFAQRAPELPMDAVAADISDHQDPRWERFDIETVPTLLAFEDGEEIARRAGPPGRGLKAEDIDRLLDEIRA